MNTAWVRRCIRLPTYSYTSYLGFCDAIRQSDHGQLQLVSHHVIEIQEIGFKKFGTELRRVVSL